MSIDTTDKCAHCGGDLDVLGWLGNIEYRGCVECKADATWNTEKPWKNPAVPK